MDCKDFEKNVAAYVEGELEDNLLRNMEAHRAACPKCARLAELHGIIFASLNDTKPVRAPKGLADRILAQAHAEAPDNVVEFTPGETQKTSLGCRVFEEHIAAYVDGLIDGDLLRRMDEHRAACSSCEHLVKVHQAVLVSLNTAERVGAPEGLAERILAAVGIEAAETAKVFGAVKSFIKFEKFATSLTAAASFVAASVVLFGTLTNRLPGITSIKGWVINNTGTAWSQFGSSSQTTWNWIVTTINTEWTQLSAQIQTSGYWATILDTITLKLNGVSLSLKIWMAQHLPNQWMEGIKLLTEPVELPYVSLSFPPYYLAAVIVPAAILWVYLKSPFGYKLYGTTYE